MSEPLQFRAPRYDYDNGYYSGGKHRAATTWRFTFWALLIQWFAILGLVLLLIWEV